MEKKEKLKEFIHQIGYVRLLLLGICGFFLIIVSIPEKEEKKEAGVVQIPVMNEENDLYIDKMEKRLKEVLTKMEGVGKTEVMITLLASSEKIINKDRGVEESQESQSGEEESSKTVRKENEETVLSEEDGNPVPYVIKKVEPQVQGIVAVIEGGGNPVVVKEVTEAIEALFHVDAHKIKVLKMEDES